MEHIGAILPGFLADLITGPTTHEASLICRKGAVVEQMTELAQLYGDAKESEVFRLGVKLEGGTTIITIDRYKEVRDKLPGALTDGQVQEAFERMFGSDEK